MVDTNFAKSQLYGRKLDLKCKYLRICVHMTPAHLNEKAKKKPQKVSFQVEYNNK